MERRKLTKEDIDKVRNIEGFPIGTDEDIIALSDAPFYTACPNPFIEDFIKEYGTPYDEATDNYHREPFAADVSEGKNDPLYTVHTYHTKVPYKAIMNYILHYTTLDDIVLDGFSGTGMTGVAARACGSVSNIDKVKYEKDLGSVEVGARKAILLDLSPAATHITNRYNSGFNISEFEEEGKRLLQELKNECGWMYKTRHSCQDEYPTFIPESNEGTINYTVWSDVMICPHCGKEYVYWERTVDRARKKMYESYKCAFCQAEISKKDSICAEEVMYDDIRHTTYSIPKQVPVLICYTSSSGKRHEKIPDENDLAVIEKIKGLQIPYWFPTDALPKGYNTKQPISKGIKTVDAFFTKRNLYCLSFIWSRASDAMRFAITAFILRATKMNKVHMHNFLFGGGGWNAGYLTGVLYFPSLSVETSIVELLSDRIDSLKKAFLTVDNQISTTIVSTQSTTDLKNIPYNSIGYIFTDPPFGGNLNYSELNFIWEAWLKVRTNNSQEAVMNPVQNKGLVEYQQLMTECFKEYYRVLKPNRWMTVEFHNSKNSVWNAIQESLLRAGFIIADVRTLDKKQGSFKQVTTTSAVKQDLVISCYKPKDSFRREFLSHAGSEDTAWAFVRQHLANIPVVVVKNDRIEVVAERQAYLLFDRMVAYHIMQGIPVPLDATDFYRGLDEKFLKRDNMYFLPDQVNEYDTARITTEVENIQFELFVTNEKSAISWLYQQLDEQFCGPQTYAELQPKFMQEVKAVDKYEQMPELATILEENFLQDGKGRWYIPDVTKEGDLVKLREKNLWKEFEGYMNSKGKLKLFRSEAIRVGFSRLWKEKNYKAIVDIAERLPEQTIQEDSNLLMYYDISLGRV